MYCTYSSGCMEVEAGLKKDGLLPNVEWVAYENMEISQTPATQNPKTYIYRPKQSPWDPLGPRARACPWLQLGSPVTHVKRSPQTRDVFLPSCGSCQDGRSLLGSIRSVTSQEAHGRAQPRWRSRKSPGRARVV